VRRNCGARTGWEIDAVVRLPLRRRPLLVVSTHDGDQFLLVRNMQFLDQSIAIPEFKSRVRTCFVVASPIFRQRGFIESTSRYHNRFELVNRTAPFL